VAIYSVISTGPKWSGEISDTVWKRDLSTSVEVTNTNTEHFDRALKALSARGEISDAVWQQSFDIKKYSH